MKFQKFCPGCGASNEAEKKFCESCGTNLVIEEDVTPVIESAPVTETVPESAPEVTVPVSVVDAEPSEDSIAEEKRKASVLCWISLGLMFGVPLISSGVYALMARATGAGGDTTITTNINEAIGTIMSSVSSLSYIASWVLMIVARVKYKHSTFAKVIMWIYIAELILGVIAIIAFFLFCFWLLRSCQGM